LREPIRRLGIRELRAQREQVLLHVVEQRAHGRIGTVGAGEAQDGVELVHLAVGGDAQVVFGHARAVDEAGLSRVAALGVDLHVPGILSRPGSKRTRRPSCSGAPPAAEGITYRGSEPGAPRERQRVGLVRRPS
jgi:hypothetical protein